MDITGNLVWAQCEPCSSCIRLTPPATPTFLPNKSDSFHAVACASQTCQRMIRGGHGCPQEGDPCTYTEEFSGGGLTSGFLAADTVLRTELVTRIRSQGVDPVSADDHLCYLTHDFSNAKFPVLALVFDGANATMELKVENYFLAFAGGQLTCLTILPSTGGSILGSLMQAGRTMTYDILGGQLSFQTAAVSALAPARVSLVVMVTLVAWVLAAQSLF
jgi:hypothetical protein